MKNLFLLLICVFANGVFAQTYNVIHVKGKVTVAKTNKALAAGMSIDAKEQLKFEKDAKVAVMNTENGRMMLDGNKGKANAQGEFLAFVADVLIPSKSNLQLSTRSGKNSQIVNFKDFFGTENYAFIGENLHAQIDADKYSLSEQKFFVFSFEANGKTIARKIGNEGNLLKFEKAKLYKSKEETFDAEKVGRVKILYLDKENGSNTELVSFVPVFIPETDLENTCKELVAFHNTKKSSKEAILTDILNFVYENYGKIDQQVLGTWLADKKILD